MNPLIAALQGWSGPDAVETALVKQGFTAIERHRAFRKEVCRSHGLPCDIDVFWRECALEFMSSGGMGKVGMRGRLIGQEGIYRSAYLDDLDRYWRERSAKEKIRYMGTIHPCDYEIHVRKLPEMAWGKDVNQVLNEAELAPEHICVPLEHPLKTKKDALHYLQLAGETFGLEPVNIKRLQPSLGRQGYKVDGGRGLQFYVGCDVGGLPDVNTPPVQSFIYHRDWRDDFVYLGAFDYALPNVWFYGGFQSEQTCAIGIYALVAALKALAESFPR